MDFDKGSPVYPDGTPATPVTNDGSELGTGKGEDYDTGSVGFIGYYGDDLSGRAGCSNNNWGVVHVTRRDIPDGKIFRKLLQTSKAEGQTIFEDGYTTFGKGDGERTLNYKYTGKGYILAEKVAAGTEIRVRLQINAKEVAGCRESGCKLTFYDSFDYTNKFLPSKGVVIRNGDRTYTDGVKVAWTEVPAVQGDDDKEPDTWHFNSTPDDEMPVDWSDGMPTEADVEEADDMSVKASYEITPEQAASDDPWEAVFYVRMQEGTNYSQDHMLGVVETKDGNAVKGNYSGAVDGVSVLPMYATASESVSVTDAQGGYRSAVRPGDTLEYGLSSNVKNVKVYDGFKARFTACADGLRYEWNIYNNLTGLAGEVRTVIKLPSNNDSKLANGGKGPDGTWNGYDRGGSKFTDYVLAGEPRLDDADTITSQGEQAAAWLGGGDWDTGDRLAKAFDARFAGTPTRPASTSGSFRTSGCRPRAASRRLTPPTWTDLFHKRKTTVLQRWFFVAQLALAKPLVDAAMTLMALDAWYSRMAGIEPDSPVMSFFNTYFNDDFMAERFQTMSLDPGKAGRLGRLGRPRWVLGNR